MSAIVRAVPMRRSVFARRLRAVPSDRRRRTGQRPAFVVSIACIALIMPWPSVVPRRLLRLQARMDWRNGMRTVLPRCRSSVVSRTRIADNGRVPSDRRSLNRLRLAGCGHAGPRPRTLRGSHRCSGSHRRTHRLAHPMRLLRHLSGRSMNRSRSALRRHRLRAHVRIARIGRVHVPRGRRHRSHLRRAWLSHPWLRPPWGDVRPCNAWVAVSVACIGHDEQSFHSRNQPDVRMYWTHANMRWHHNIPSMPMRTWNAWTVP